jgi:hypothetical protein
VEHVGAPRSTRRAGAGVLVLEAVLWLLAYAAHGGNLRGSWRIVLALLALGLAGVGLYAPRIVGVFSVFFGLVGAIAGIAIIVVENVGGAAVALILLPTAICPIAAGALFLFDDHRSADPR